MTLLLADLLPPPTFCMDWYMVGWPASVILPCVLCAALISLFWFLKRPGGTRRNLLLMVLCIGLFIAADFGVYLFGVNFPSARRGPRPPQEFFKDETRNKQ